MSNTIVAKTEEELRALLAGIKNGTIVSANMPVYPHNSVVVDQDAYNTQARAYDAPDVPKPPKPSMGRSASNSVRGGLGKVETALGLTELGRSQTRAIADGVRATTRLMGGSASSAGRNGRLAMQALRHPALAAGLKWAGPVGGALAVGDLVLGEESLANKGMDAALMTAGGFLGSAVPVVGTGLGIAAGKIVSDGTQYIFGGGKSAEERKLEEALALLQQRGLI